MLSILAITFPFFALVLCGYGATRHGLLPIGAIPGLSTFVLFFALPAMLFRFGAATPLAQLLDIPLLVLYSASALLLVAVVVMFSRNERINIKDAAFGALVAAFPNSGFMGIPLILTLLGEHAVAVVFITLMVDFFLTSSICLSLAEMKSSRGEAKSRHAVLRGFIRSLRGALANPMPWAIAVGVLFGVSGLTMPEPVDKTIALLSDAASPVALFAIGAILARNVVRAKHRSPLLDYVLVALAKLLLHPLLVFLACRFAQWLGLGVSVPAETALILVAALPSASNVTMLAERFGADSDRIARVIMVSTALSFFTFSGMVWLLAA